MEMLKRLLEKMGKSKLAQKMKKPPREAKSYEQQAREARIRLGKGVIRGSLGVGAAAGATGGLLSGLSMQKKQDIPEHMEEIARLSKERASELPEEMEELYKKGKKKSRQWMD